MKATPEKKKPWPKTSEELAAAGYVFEKHDGCKGNTCSTTISFYKTPKGNRMPLSIVKDSNPTAYQPHWADCPDQKQFRGVRI